MKREVTKAFLQLLKDSANNKVSHPKTIAARQMIAKAIEETIRKGILSGDIVSDIFDKPVWEAGQVVEWPLDILAPGEEDQYIAYSAPGHGRIPERAIQGDYVRIGTYEIVNSIDWLRRLVRNANYDVVARATEVFENGFTKKMNDDGWHTLLAAVLDRDIMVFDSDAAAGQFTKKLISLTKTTMRRNGGGNSNSLNRHKLTDLYLSPEGIEDMRNWGVDQLDETSRREVHTADDNTGMLARIFSVNLHDIDELGEGQEYQNYFTSDLGGDLDTDKELVIGLDRTKENNFVMPIVRELEVEDDPTLRRQSRNGIFGEMELGVGVLDTRNVIAASF